MEMVSDKGIQYNNEKTLHMLHIDEGENPVSIQLFGSDEDSLARAAEFIQENTKTDIVDINMGCPVNKIVKNEAGAMWLKDPDKIYSIINKVQSVLDIPLTVKMRTGWADPSLAVENALAAEAAGVSALAMHGRTREQMYTGHADLETLYKVAQALTKIPFIANGDIRTVQEAKQRIEEVGADAVMIGRAAMGNPYLFNQINHYFETGEILPDLTFEDKMKIAYEHLKRLINLKGENVAVREFAASLLTTSVEHLALPNSVEPFRKLAPWQRLKPSCNWRRLNSLKPVTLFKEPLECRHSFLIKKTP